MAQRTAATPGDRGKRFVVVSYDISDDKRRRRVTKHMENFGRRVQYSVFECELRPEQIKTLKERLKPLVKAGKDSIRFYYLPDDAVTGIETMGDSGVRRDPLFYMATSKEKAK